MFTHSNPRFRFLSLLLVAALALAACASARAPSMSEEAAPPMAAPAEPGAGRNAFEQEQVVSDQAGQAIERIVIKNANLSLAVDDPSASMNAIGAMAEEMGGFVVNANLYYQELDSGVQVPRASTTVRVPAERLNEALERIRSQSSRLPLSESIDSQDVTREYTDLQSRLRNLQNTEKQLQNIMDRATRTEDVLSVYNQLTQVREQIEVIQGQIQYYEQSARLSSVRVELLADEAVQPLTIGNWQPAGEARQAVQALVNTLKFVANAVIWLLIYLLPVLLVLYLIFVLPLTLVVRYLRRRRAARPAPPPPAA